MCHTILNKSSKFEKSSVTPLLNSSEISIFLSILNQTEIAVYDYFMVLVKRFGPIVVEKHDKIAIAVGIKRNRVMQILKKLRDFRLLDWVNQGIKKANIYYLPRCLVQYSTQLNLAKVLPCLQYLLGVNDDNVKLNNGAQLYDFSNSRVLANKNELPGTHARAREELFFKPSGEHQEQEEQPSVQTNLFLGFGVRSTMRRVILARKEVKPCALLELFSKPLISITGWIRDYEAERLQKKKERLKRKHEKKIMEYQKYFEEYESIVGASLTIDQRRQIEMFMPWEIEPALRALYTAVKWNRRDLKSPFGYFYVTMRQIKLDKPAMLKGKTRKQERREAKLIASTE